MHSRLAIVLLAAAIPSSALAEGDAAAGQKLFNRCKVCHAADKEQNKVGPHLVGIIGRPAGAIADFPRYSAAMKAKAAEGLVWDEATLAAYLADPRGYIPGNSMAFAGLKKPGEIENVIAYLKSLPKP